MKTRKLELFFAGCMLVAVLAAGPSQGVGVGEWGWNLIQRGISWLEDHLPNECDVFTCTTNSSPSCTDYGCINGGQSPY